MSGGGLDRCEDCVWFSWRDNVPQEDQRLWGQHLDGWCSKIFPHGYLGAGKPGGKVWHGKNACFQFEARDADQLVMKGVRDGPKE